MNDMYRAQVKLLLKVLPFIEEDKIWALKGGTAINLFFTNMPRLSVDIDLTYVNLDLRDMFIKNINQSLINIKKRIESIGCGVDLTFHGKEKLPKLTVRNQFATIKIEPSILRGSVYPTITSELCPKAQNEFLQTLNVTTLSHEDVYGGKITAALTRQHPRDLFDIKYLLDNGGITDQTRLAFIAYMLSSPRPMHEILNPSFQLQEELYKKQFVGMTDTDISYDDLVSAREELVRQINLGLTDKEKQFLILFKKGIQKWELLENVNIQNMPSIARKINNLKRVKPDIQYEQLLKLEKVLNNG